MNLQNGQEICCPQCGRPLIAAGAPCQHCAEARGNFHVRPLFLVLLLLGSAAFCAATVFAARFYESSQKRLGQMWFGRGQSALAAGQPQAAIRDFRDALYYSHDNPEYRLRLAEALLAAGRIREAQSYLLTLWQDEPGNSTVNLELARLAARQGETQAVLRYYHGAIYGMWPEGDAAARRRQTRLELIHYLLGLRDNTQAEAELIALTSELPANSASHAEVGALFRQAGDMRQALAEFEQAFRLNSRNSSAWLGAGQSAFDLGNYPLAERYLDRAVRLQPHAAQAQDLLATSRLVLEWTPYGEGVNSRQRALRVVQAFRQAAQRLSQCAAAKGVALAPGAAAAASESGVSKPPSTDVTASPAARGGSGLMARIFSKVRPGAGSATAANATGNDVAPAQLQPLAQSLAQLKPAIRAYRLERDPQTADAAMGLVAQIETVTARQCGTPQGPDLALLLLARQEEGR